MNASSKKKNLQVDVAALATTGKRSMEDRTPTNAGNDSKKKTLGQRLSEAATGIIQAAAPVPTNEQGSWVGDESDADISPKYKQQLQSQEKGKSLNWSQRVRQQKATGMDDSSTVSLNSILTANTNVSAAADNPNSSHVIEQNPGATKDDRSIYSINSVMTEWTNSNEVAGKQVKDHKKHTIMQRDSMAQSELKGFNIQDKLNQQLTEIDQDAMEEDTSTIQKEYTEYPQEFPHTDDTIEDEEDNKEGLEKSKHLDSPKDVEMEAADSANGQEGQVMDEEGSKENSSECKESGNADKDVDEDSEEEEETDKLNQQMEREQQDDTNTVESGTTTKVKGKKQAKEIVIPKFVRYQLMITPLKKEVDDAGVELKTAPKRIRETLISLCSQLELVDDEAQIISWNNKKNFSYMNTKEFSEDTAVIAKYFNGFRQGLMAERRIYLKMGIHTPNDQKKLLKELKQWTQLYGYTITECMIQADNASFIGWIAYSSYYTNTGKLKEILQEEGEFEWGFKMVPLESDKNKPWKDRLKALGVYVPAIHHEVATKIISNMMESEPEDHKYYPRITDKYLFVPPKDTVDELNSKLAYKSFIRRHRAHSNQLTATFSSAIQLDVDKDMLTRGGDIATLRNLILNIRSTDTTSIFYGEHLFHQVDYTEDSSKNWFGTGPGPGGDGYIFTYYKDCAPEAKKMIRGLGIFLVKYYGSKAIVPFFSREYWKGTHKWNYSSKRRCFITPEDNLIKNNLIHDRNKSLMDKIVDKEIREREERERALQAEGTPQAMIVQLPDASNPQATSGERYAETAQLLENATRQQGSNEDNSVISDITREAQKEEMLLIKKLMNADLDSVGKVGDKKKAISEVVIQSDQSTTSSITANSASTASTTASNIKDEYSINSGSTNNSNKFKVNGKQFTFEAIGIHDEMTDMEIKQRLEAHTEFQRHKEDLRKEKLYNEYIANRKSQQEEHDNETNNPGHIPKSTSSKNDKQSKSEHGNPPISSSNSEKETSPSSLGEASNGNPSPKESETPVSSDNAGPQE